MRDQLGHTSVLVALPPLWVAKRVTRTNPDTAWRSGAAELLGARLLPCRRSERAIRAGKEILAHDAEIVVPLVEDVIHSSEQLQMLCHLVARIEIQQTVSGQAFI